MRKRSSRGHGRGGRIAFAAALLAMLAGCHPSPRASPPARSPPRDSASPAPDAHPRVDESYDWHGLLIAPFGTVLKDVPGALHEVLLFRDEDARAAPEEGECYALDAPAPRFAGNIPEEYLLCFKQDRLSRVQAAVHLTAADRASEVFAAACAEWLKNSGPAASPAESPHPAAPGGAASDAASCEGRDGPIRFRGRLGKQAGIADGSPADPILSITLDVATGP